VVPAAGIFGPAAERACAAVLAAPGCTRPRCAEEGGDVDWAALAADLGYADQAHLTRDFTAALGMPPSASGPLSARCRAG
jgi:AraC-like DNA-binding protein